jgi:hypothetical protein
MLQSTFSGGIAMAAIDGFEGSGSSREELVARLQVMEQMVAEGRRATGRFGWIFVLWGLVDIAGVFWQTAKPHWFGPWPIVLSVGIILQIVGLRFFCGTGSKAMKSRAISSIWQVMGITIMFFCFTAMFTHHAWGSAYTAAIFMLLGMAHGVVSALWIAGGMACFVVSGEWQVRLFLGEMVVCMVLFGLYAMLLEGRRTAGGTHA